VEFACPHCFQHVMDDGTLAGQTVACPHCAREFRMPIPEMASAPPEPIPAMASAPFQQVACPHCGQGVVNDGSQAGQLVPCPACRGKFQLPVPQAMELPDIEPQQPEFLNPMSEAQSVSQRYHRRGRSKSPIIAALLCLIFIGLGQIYNGDVGKGILLFLTAIAIGIAAFCQPELALVYFMANLGLLLFSMFEAYAAADRFNREGR